MTNSAPLPRKLLIFGVTLPLALYVGYLLGTPDLISYSMLTLVLLILTIPLFLESHHYLLALSWNLPLMMFFLPGSPPQWMLVTAISLPITLLGRLLNPEKKFCRAPSVGWSLLAIAAVVLFTMKATGAGLGLRSMGGSSFGGKKYIFMLVSVAAFFALSLQPIPLEKSKKYLASFLLPAMVTVMSNLIYFFPSFWFLYYLFPTDWAMGQAFEDFSAITGAVNRFGRLGGLTVSCMALFTFLLAWYGVRGVLNWRKPWRFALLTATIIISLLGGFRSALLFYVLSLGVQFVAEGLHRTRLVIPIAGLAILAGTALIPFSDKLPLSAQRCLSFLPYKVDPIARADAEASTEWRLQMWSLLWPEVGKYFWIGKGYTASATDYYLTQESIRRGLSASYEMMIVSGDYHSGPLSVIIPYGIWGALAFLWFLIAALRVLYLNYRNGDPSLRLTNTFLFSSFLVKVILFFAVFGAIHSDLILLVGLVGLSVSMNAGICRQPVTSNLPSLAEGESTAVSPARFGPGWRPSGMPT